MLDNLPAWSRHLLVLAVIAPVAGFVGFEAAAVVANHGISGMDWSGEAQSALDVAAVTSASGVIAWVAMFVTPLTRQYGVGK